jgi:hypothetical protein
MSAPWEKYGAAPAAEDGPWAKYGTRTNASHGATASEDNALVTGARALGAGLGKGFGSTVLGLQGLVGSGLQKLGDAVSPDTRNLSGLVTGKKERGLIQSAGDWLANDAETGRAKLASELAPLKAASPKMAGAGEIGGEIIATLPVGGALAKVASPLLASTRAAPLINAIGSGGFRTGLPTATTLGGKAADLGIRAAGGAITGGASASLINQNDAGAGAAIGGALPVALSGLGPLGSYMGRAANSVVQPFTTKGQEAIAGRIIKKFAEGGPTTIDVRQLVPGSAPTLAEATGNAGLATFQRGARDLNPNAFVARETQNAGARNALFDTIAGDTTKLSAAKDARESVAGALYKKATDSDAMRRELAQAEGVRQSALDYARRGGMGSMKTAEQAAADSILPSGALQDLNSRSSFRLAVQSAKKLAENKGEDIGNPLTSINGLHYVKLAIDDMLEPSATNSLARNAKSGLMDTKSKLMDEIEKLSPQYGTARGVFQDMSQPVNAMEALQGLRLTDAQGNITLAKVKSAMEGLERSRNAPGVHPAKSIDDEQMKALEAIHADLLRQASLGSGRSVGSNTFQNIATNNILSALLPGRLGEVAVGKVGGLLGQVGRLAYSGPNEAIRNKLLELALQPELAAGALASAGPRIPGRVNALADLLAPAAYRAAPALSTSR